MTEPLARVSEAGAQQLLVDHLAGVARRCSEYCTAFGLGNLGLLAGLVHDVEKRVLPWQQYLLGQAPMTTYHAKESAAHYLKQIAAQIIKQGPEHVAVWFSVLHHHSGMRDMNAEGNRSIDWGRVELDELRNIPIADRFLWLDAQLKTLPALEQLSQEQRKDIYTVELFFRMLFSSLCDADALDAENAETPGRERLRAAGFDSLPVISQRLENTIDALQNAAQPSFINTQRALVRERCRVAALLPPGIHYLNVPTGLGKTLSGLEWAILHAIKYNKSKIIILQPFEALIEQTVAAISGAVGPNNVIEHHSGYDPEKNSSDRRFTFRDMLITNNWAAPILVSTTVQFFESLLARKVRKSRKNHNIANTVVFIDEAQTIPAHVLFPVLNILDTLVKHFGVSLLISTATVPVWDFEGQERVRAVMNRMRGPGNVVLKTAYGFKSINQIVAPGEITIPPRVAVEWPDEFVPTTWPELVNEITASTVSSITKVVLRDDVQALCEELDARRTGAEIIALSALLTPMDRSRVIADVRNKLRNKKLIHLVTTSLVEAGIDFDFPLGFAPIAGLDSIIQFAGRVNREGRLAAARLKLYASPTKNIMDYGLEAAITTVWEMRTNRRNRGEDFDIFNPQVQREYWEKWYRRVTRKLAQGDEIQAERRKLNFQTVSEKFRMIESDWSAPVVIVQDEICAEAVRNIERGNRPWAAYRTLRTYTVNIAKTCLAKWLDAGLIRMLNLDDEIFADDAGDDTKGEVKKVDTATLLLVNPTALQYDPRYGVQVRQLNEQSLQLQPLIV
ncbi:MAG: CRISPR-associated endonuclease Cas3'' [Patescibacteria group bacterium]